MSTAPFLSDAIWITSKFAIAALAGFVPCAESGIITLVLLWSSLFSWYAFIIISPVNSPWEPAEGCSVTSSIPVISASLLDKSYIKEREPWAVSEDWYGCIPVKFGSAAISSFILGLYFIVQEPKG